MTNDSGGTPGYAISSLQSGPSLHELVKDHGTHGVSYEPQFGKKQTTPKRSLIDVRSEQEDAETRLRPRHISQRPLQSWNPRLCCDSVSAIGSSSPKPTQRNMFKDQVRNQEEDLTCLQRLGIQTHQLDDLLVFRELLQDAVH